MKNVKYTCEKTEDIEKLSFANEYKKRLKSKGYEKILITCGKRGLHVDYMPPNSEIICYEFIRYP